MQKYYPILVIKIFILIILIFPKNIWALDTLSTQRDKVRIKGSIPLAERIAATVTVINMDTYQQRSLTLPEILAQTPGVNIKRVGGVGSFATVSIRGTSGENVRVYLDGILMNQASGGAVDMGMIPADNLERIEIYRGILPAGMDGSGMGGVIHLKTKQGRHIKGVTFKTTAGSFNTYTGGGFGVIDIPHGNIVMLGNAQYSKNEFTYWGEHPTSGEMLYLTRTNAHFTGYNIQIKPEFKVPIGKILLNINGIYSDKGVPGNSNALPTRMAKYSKINLVSSATLRFKPSFIPFATKGSFNYFNTIKKAHFLDTLTYDNGDVAREAEVFMIKMDSDNLSIAHGVALHADFLPLMWLKSGIHLTYTNEQFDYINRLDNQNTFLPMYQNKGQISTNIDLTSPEGRAAATLTYNGALVQASYLKIKYYQLVNTRRSVEEHYQGGSMGGMFRYAKWLTLKLNMGKYYRIPSTSELFGNSGKYLGNSELEAESGYTADVGGRISSPWLHMGFTFFYAHYNNLIVNLINSQHIIFPSNIGKADNKGIESTWSINGPHWFALYGNVTWQQPFNRYGNYMNYAVPNYPQVEVFHHVDFKYKSWHIFHEYQFMGQNYQDVMNLKYWPARHLHGFGITYRIKKTNINLNFEIKNAFNKYSKNLMDMHGYPLPGRHYLLTAQYECN